MAPRARSRRSDLLPPGADAPLARRRADPVLQVQRMAGNRATAQVLARKPAVKDNGTVKVGKVSGKVTGGNADDWAAKKDPETLEATSEKGKHSKELEKLSKEHTKIPSLKLTTPMVDQSGAHLDYGSVEIEFYNARIDGYTVDGKAESWR